MNTQEYFQRLCQWFLGENLSLKMKKCHFFRSRYILSYRQLMNYPPLNTIEITVKNRSAILNNNYYF